MAKEVTSKQPLASMCSERAPVSSAKCLPFVESSLNPVRSAIASASWLLCQRIGAVHWKAGELIELAGAEDSASGGARRSEPDGSAPARRSRGRDWPRLRLRGEDGGAGCSRRLEVLAVISGSWGGVSETPIAAAWSGRTG